MFWTLDNALIEIFAMSYQPFFRTADSRGSGSELGVFYKSLTLT